MIRLTTDDVSPDVIDNTTAGNEVITEIANDPRDGEEFLVPLTPNTRLTEDGVACVVMRGPWEMRIPENRMDLHNGMKGIFEYHGDGESWPLDVFDWYRIPIHQLPISDEQKTNLK